jgi:formylglycine-generating enzyme required for sulfatase activity
LTENGTPLARDKSNGALFSIPYGLKRIVARHPQLGLATNEVPPTSVGTGSPLRFNFTYGTLVLTNLPANVTVYEGDAKVGVPADGVVYQRPGTHLYVLRGQATPQEMQLNIQPGLNYLRLASAEKSWKNSLGMWFAWVPNLPGGGLWPGQNVPGGWVAISELTQGQYKKMDGSNPSFYRDGGDNYPVENVTLEQAMTYCRWLCSIGAAECGGWRYTLPSDEQFAAFAADADRLARVTAEGRMNSAERHFPTQRVPRIPAAQNLNNARTHPEIVGSTKQANQYGLYDVVAMFRNGWPRRVGRKMFMRRQLSQFQSEDRRNESSRTDRGKGTQCWISRNFGAVPVSDVSLRYCNSNRMPFRTWPQPANRLLRSWMPTNKPAAAQAARTNMPQASLPARNGAGSRGAGTVG